MDLELHQKQLTEIILLLPLPITLLKTQTGPDIHPKSQRYKWKSNATFACSPLGITLRAATFRTPYIPTYRFCNVPVVNPHDAPERGKICTYMCFSSSPLQNGHRSISFSPQWTLKMSVGTRKKKGRSPQLPPCRSKKQPLLSQGGMSPDQVFRFCLEGPVFTDRVTAVENELVSKLAHVSPIRLFPMCWLQDITGGDSREEESTVWFPEPSWVCAVGSRKKKTNHCWLENQANPV